MPGEETVDRYGIPVAEGNMVSPVTTEVLFGRRKTFAGLQRSEWAFVIISVINVIVCLALTFYRLYRIVKLDETKDSDFTFALVIILNSGFCLVYVVNGILREREFEIYVYCIAVVVVLAYCIVEYAVNDDPETGRTTIKLVRLIVACVLAPINIVLGVYIAREFGWLEFRVVGASAALQMMYNEAARFISLLKFDFQVTLTLLILVLRNGIQIDLLEKIVLGVGIPFSLIWVLLGYIAIRYEQKCIYAMFAMLGITQPAYVIFKIVVTFMVLLDNLKVLSRSDHVLLYSTLGAGFLALTLRLIVYIESIRCRRNFGEGLREIAFDGEANENTSLLSRPRRR